ncbi:hypothetical protein FNF28_01618 [Cafeteria roenbergensis]|uniref:C2 domain-containing protein n=1 Tax=Cafeteria roenbergensis TaxID=33653 RepID=A0A5A8E006_CAFRO|nr:hypothetical protein FNF28_01618 [Cafeteria roenbergensis]
MAEPGGVPSGTKASFARAVTGFASVYVTVGARSIGADKAPFVVFYKSKGDGYELAERTETAAKGTEDPSFSIGLKTKYVSGKRPPYKLELYNERAPKMGLPAQEYLGEIEFKLRKLVAAPAFTLRVPMIHREKGEGGSTGSICVTGIIADSASAGAGFLRVKMKAEGLRRQGSLDPDPCIRFLAANASGDVQPVFETPPERRSTAPEWPSFRVPMLLLCQNDTAKKFTVSVLHYKEAAEPKELGSAELSVDDILGLSKRKGSVALELNGSKAGMLQIARAKVEAPMKLGSKDSKASGSASPMDSPRPAAAAAAASSGASSGATTPTSSRPASPKPGGAPPTKPAVPKPTSAKPSAAKPSSPAKPSAAKPASAKPSSPKPDASKPTTPKPVKPSAAKPTSAKPSSPAKPSAAKPTSAKPSSPKPDAAKPTTPKPVKPSAAKPTSAKPSSPAKPSAAKPASAKPSSPKPDAAKPSAAKPTSAKPSSPAKPSAAKPASAKPSSPKPDAAKPTTPKPVKPSAAKPTSAKPSSPAKPSAAKPASAKPSSPKPDAAKPSAAKPASAKPSSPKPDAAKPSAAKPTSAKPSSPAKPSVAKPTSAKPSSPKPDAAKPSANQAEAAKPSSPKSVTPRKPEAGKQASDKPSPAKLGGGKLSSPTLPADSGFTELDEAEARHSDSCSITAFVKRAVGAGPGRTRQTQPTAQDLEERAAAVEAAAQEAGRLLTRRAATLETRLNEMRASLASGSGDRHLRSSLQRGLDHVRQQQAQLSSALEAFRMRSFVEAVLGCGLHAARVALAAQRVPVLTLRQDLALCRRHLLIALAEASAVEVDVVGQTGGRLGSNGRDGAERGRIIADMPLQDAELYARQARSLLSEARVDGAADAAVGTSHLRRSFEQLGVALRDTAEAACAGGEERARQEREAVLEHIRKVVPVLAKRMAVDRDLKDKHARLSGDLDRMKEAVANIMASQQAKVVALAEAVANAERRSDLKGEAAVAELAAPLDSSEKAVAARLAADVVRAETEAVVESSEVGEARLRRLNEQLDAEVAAAEAEVEQQERSLRGGQWMKLDKSPTERRLEAVTATIAAQQREAEALQADSPERDEAESAIDAILARVRRSLKADGSP